MRASAFANQNAGVAGVQELENLGAWRRFSQEMLVLDFRIKTLLRYSATPELLQLLTSLTPDSRILL
jgi:hypothetical protein